MSKIPYHQDETMSEAAHISEASRWASWLTQIESRGPGDIPNAWRRLEARYGVPYQTFRSLRYQRPKDIWTSIYLRLKAAHDTEKQRQFRKLQQELQIARSLGADVDDLASSASSLVSDTTKT